MALQHRHDLVTNDVAPVAEVHIAFILDPAQAVVFGVGAQRRAREIEQRPGQPAGTEVGERRDRRQAVYAGAAQ
jgi:hypothetical protein